MRSLCWTLSLAGAEQKSLFPVFCPVMTFVCTMYPIQILQLNKGFTCATLASAGIGYHRVSVCLSVCLSQVGVLLKWLNVGSHEQCHTIAQGL